MTKVYVTTQNKDRLRLLGSQFESLGFSIMASAGSAKALGDRYRMSVAPIASFLPECDDVRSRTVHQDILAAVEADPTNPVHMADLRGRSIELIDVLVCNLRRVRHGGGDWGGVQLIQTALSSKRVLVVIEPDEYAQFIEEINEEGQVSREYRHYLDLQAAAYVSKYVADYETLRRSDHFPLV